MSDVWRWSTSKASREAGVHPVVRLMPRVRLVSSLSERFRQLERVDPAP